MAPKNGAPALRLQGWDEIAVPIPPVDCLVREFGFVSGSGAPHLVAGYGFSGKTVALQSLALSLAAGRPVWGAFTGRLSRVLHVDLEQGDILTRLRYQRLARAMGIGAADVGDRLVMATMPRLTLRRECWHAWHGAMAGRDLVIVDSLRAASAGIDENSSEIRGCLDLMGKLSEHTGCRSVIIHHTKKPSPEGPPAGKFAIRGSSGIFDACDCVWLFSAAKGEPVSVSQEKARSRGYTVPDFALVVSDVAIGGDLTAGLRVQVHGHELVTERHEQRIAEAQRSQLRQDAQKVREAIGQRPGISSRELRALTHLSGDRVSAALLQLGRAVEVREERRAPTGPLSACHYLVSLSDSGT